MPIRLLITVHRWLGVALCLLFLLWFPSGIGMMYWGMPAITARDRLDRWPVLDPDKVVVSPQEAAARIGFDGSPALIRLNTFDGRPAYRFGGDPRDGGGGQVVYADTGDEQGTASLHLRNRAAVSWTGQSLDDATIVSMTEPDQWIVGNRLRNLRPLWKYSWPNGEDVYIGESGEVLMHTTRSSRLAAYVSAVPHWLYFTPLRKNQPFWIRFATYTAMIGTAGAIIGLVLAVWLYSPAKKYRHAGTPSSIPYRGPKRWHTVLGLIFGLATITWTFSGSLAFLPFPTPQPSSQPRPPQAQAGRRAGNPSLAAALRGPVTMQNFAAVHPQDVLGRQAQLDVKELEFTAFDGQPLYRAKLADGTSRIMSVDGQNIPELHRERIVTIVKETVPHADAFETRLVDQYDIYYRDRTRQQPLPVILALTHDDAETRYYIDPKTATVVGTYSNRNWWRRWLYNGFHSLDFPFLYNHRPLWDIVVITFMLGGTALCLTSLVLAWRALGKKLRRLSRPVFSAPV